MKLQVLSRFSQGTSVQIQVQVPAARETVVHGGGGLCWVPWDCLGPQLFGICLELNFIPQLFIFKNKSKLDAMKAFTIFIFAVNK